MSKYIDVEPLENALMAVQKRSDVISIKEVLNTLMNYPAADVVEVRHGKWEWHNEEACFYSCSNCGHNAYGNTGEILSGYYNYCPKCGSSNEVEE